jgi:hypothetical protein
MRVAILAQKLDIDKAGLLQACKEIIETILFCLPNAYKGTVYRVGNPPELVVKQVTSGVIDQERRAISWGIPERSRYAPPGRPWSEYRDEPGRPPEAMAWCVEKQESWTAEDPENDKRRTRVQQEGLQEDFHHMEPVLIPKEDLYLGDRSGLEYPMNHKGEVIWQGSNYIVVDIIKIHFRPHTSRINSPETRVIKKLSRVLGTELLSHQFRQQSVGGIRKLAEDRQRSCNILADSIRNAVTKSGFIFSLIKLELEFLRKQWEEVLLQKDGRKDMKQDAVQTLNQAIADIKKDADPSGKYLIEAQNTFLEIFPSPQRGKNWIFMQIEQRWEGLLAKTILNDEQARRIHRGIESLKRSLYLGQDPDILKEYKEVPDLIKEKWIEIIYRDSDRVEPDYLEELTEILKDPSLKLPYQSKSRDSLIRLRTLAQVMTQLEQNTNVVLRQVLNANDDGMISSVPDG